MVLSGGGGGLPSPAAAASCLKNDLQLAGFLLNRNKTDLAPKRRGRWLDFLIDTEKMEFKVSPEKVKNLYHKLNHMFHAKQITSKALVSLAGTLSAMHHAVGPDPWYDCRPEPCTLP